jgi:ABC-type uncharacterized transport system permease subunit
MDIGADATQLIENLYTALFVSRLGMSGFFGLALVCHAYSVVANRHKKTRGVGWIFPAARSFFVLGTLFASAYMGVVLILPQTIILNLMSVAIVLCVSLFCLKFEKVQSEKVAYFGFVSACLNWLLVTLIPFVRPLESAGFIGASWLTKVHIALAAIGQGCLFLAFVLSVLYMWQHRDLKHKKMDVLGFMPSLDVLDSLNYRTCLVGLVLLTSGLVTGLLLVSFDSSVGAAKVVWAFTVWGWYVFCIFSRGVWGWTGLPAARLSVFGSLFFVLALFGTLLR